jgi:ankyrin repeat protein
MWAADNGHTEVVKVLIKNGAAPNTQDFYGWTALMKAVYHGYTEIVQDLVRNGANVNMKNVGGFTVLYLAEKWQKSPEIIHILEQAGAKR